MLGAFKRKIGIRRYFMVEDLRIHYDASNYIDCDCTDWTVNDETISVVTWLSKSEFDDLNNNIVPGAVDLMYEVLGRKVYVDSTYTNSNTLRFEPLNISESNLYSMRRETVGYVKSVSYAQKTDDTLVVKIDVLPSGGVY
jgi:hypothetical protein